MIFLNKVSLVSFCDINCGAKNKQNTSQVSLLDKKYQKYHFFKYHHNVYLIKEIQDIILKE